MSIFEKNQSSSTSATRYLEFALGTESYAVELLKVKEVITPPELTPIPKAPAHILGLMNLRGLVITVIDLRKKLGISPQAKKEENAVIIFDLGDHLVGAVVDSIQKVVNIPTENVKPVPDDEGSKSAYLLGILQHENRMSLWMSPELLLNGNTTTAKAA